MRTISTIELKHTSSGHERTSKIDGGGDRGVDEARGDRVEIVGALGTRIVVGPLQTVAVKDRTCGKKTKRGRAEGEKEGEEGKGKEGEEKEEEE